MISVKDYQRRLKDLGFDPGPVDGIRGRRTIAAVKAFQQSKGLKADGLVGPKTAAALFGKDVSKPGIQVDAMPWMDEAYRKIGLHEKRDNRSLWAWLRSDGASVGDPAKIPWCGDFVETCIAKTMPDEVLPDNPYWARNWAKFGVPCGKVYGAIASFSRKGAGGHVGFVVAYDPKRRRLKILGGNQSNAVTETWISEDRLLATRWPATSMKPGSNYRIASSAGAKLSTNEA